MQIAIETRHIIKKKHRGVTFLISADRDYDVVMRLNQSVQFNGLL